MLIRPMEESDRPQLIEMMIPFYNSPAVLEKVSEDTLNRNIDNCLSDMPYVSGFTLYEQENIIGYTIIAKSYSTEFGGVCIWIEDVYLKPTHQGKGLVKEVFAYLEKYYHNSAVRFRLELANTNENALKSYKKNGYAVLSYTQMAKKI